MIGIIIEIVAMLVVLGPAAAMGGYYGYITADYKEAGIFKTIALVTGGAVVAMLFFPIVYAIGLSTLND